MKRPNEIGITGYASTKYSKRSERSTTSILAEVSRDALSSAGLRKGDVDGLSLSSYFLGHDNAVTLSQIFGLSLTWAHMNTAGGAGQVASVIQARHAIATGQATAVLCLAGDSMAGGGDNFKLMNRWSQYLSNYAAPCGYGGANGMFAVVQRKHMEMYGTEARQLGRIAIGQRRSATLNENALLREPLSIDQYLNARLIADPIRLYDCVLPCTGAEAVVVTTLDRMTDHGAARFVSGYEYYNHAPDEAVPLSGGWGKFTDRLYQDAGYGPAELDFVQIYDDYPIMVAIQLEDLGFCQKGEVGRFLDSHSFSWDGTFPMNTGGGQLSCGQAGAGGGMIGVTEATRQMLGEAGARQIADPGRVLVSGFGMVGYGQGLAASAMILEQHHG